MLSGAFDREVNGVRVSLTNRCNFDCVYCHNEGLGDTRGPMAPQDAEMGTDDVVRFLDVAVEFDVEAVKFTGGEPMLRQDLEEIIRRTPDSMETSLTTKARRGSSRTFVADGSPARGDLGRRDAAFWQTLSHSGLRGRRPPSRAPGDVRRSDRGGPPHPGHRNMTGDTPELGRGRL